jgi:hypothetical protein
MLAPSPLMIAVMFSAGGIRRHNIPSHLDRTDLNRPRRTAEIQEATDRRDGGRVVRSHGDRRGIGERKDPIGDDARIRTTAHIIDHQTGERVGADERERRTAVERHDVARIDLTAVRDHRDRGPIDGQATGWKDDGTCVSLQAEGSLIDHRAAGIAVARRKRQRPCARLDE